MDLAAFQATIRATYGERDAERGLARTHAWFVEECGELSRALFREGEQRQVEEFADVLAWLTTLADLAGVDLAAAATRYRDGCPRCGDVPCRCG
jgi:NTP pyrophosphatase (non-canonical NTP hydrolase)